MPELNCDVPDIEAELRGLLAQIPTGRITTYGDLADALGTRCAARWVGEFLRDHEHVPTCPCHRVVRQDGQVGLYVRGRFAAEKEERLREDGLNVTNGAIEAREELIFRHFESSKPLSRLIEFQHQIAKRVRLIPHYRRPRFVAGLDVSYPRGGRAVGACALVEAESGRLVWSTTRCLAAPLPYVPGFLTFRELPVLLALFEEARMQRPRPELFLVDGNGILHPRRAGVAACFGVVADVPTIGVAKSLLCGRVTTHHAAGGPDCVVVGDQVVGLALRVGRSARPLYVSPGQDIDVVGAGSIVKTLCLCHRLPEPLYWADRLSRSEASRLTGARDHL